MIFLPYFIKLNILIKKRLPITNVKLWINCKNTVANGKNLCYKQPINV